MSQQMKVIRGDSFEGYNVGQNTERGRIASTDSI